MSSVHLYSLIQVQVAETTDSAARPRHLLQLSEGGIQGCHGFSHFQLTIHGGPGSLAQVRFNKVRGAHFSLFLSQLQPTCTRYPILCHFPHCISCHRSCHMVSAPSSQIFQHTVAFLDDYCMDSLHSHRCGTFCIVSGPSSAMDHETGAQEISVFCHC